MSNIIVADITGLNKNGKSFGHFFRVAKMFEDIFESENDIIVAGGPVYKDYKGNKYILKYDVSLCELETKRGKIIAKIKEVLNGVTVLRKFQNDAIVFQDYSNTSMLLAICLQKTNSKIYIIQYKSEIDKGINAFLYKKARKRLSGVLCTKDSVGQKYEIPYLTIPDYIYTGSDRAAWIKSNPKYNYDFGIFGIIRKGKDVVGVAKKFAGINRTILIAGSIQDQEMKENLEKLARENKNIIVVNRYLSEEEYNSMILETRCMILPYIDEYYNESSSGVVYDALFSKKPVITRKYEIFDFISQYQMGILYDTLDDVDFSKIMQENEFKECQNNIEEYLLDNQAYILKLKNFIEREKSRV